MSMNSGREYGPRPARLGLAKRFGIGFAALPLLGRKVARRLCKLLLCMKLALGCQFLILKMTGPMVMTRIWLRTVRYIASDTRPNVTTTIALSARTLWLGASSPRIESKTQLASFWSKIGPNFDTVVVEKVVVRFCVEHEVLSVHPHTTFILSQRVDRSVVVTHIFFGVVVLCSPMFDVALRIFTVVFGVVLGVVVVLSRNTIFERKDLLEREVLLTARQV